MKYSDGSAMKLGDKVKIDGKHHGVIVADIDGAEYSDEYTEEQWSYLGSGVMIDTDFGGLVHYKQENMEHEEIMLSPNE